MYRKEQRHMQEMEDQQQVISRVSNYPVVKDVWSKMSEVYQHGKDGSRVIRFCGGMVESSASLAYRVSQPVIEKLPVETVNGYAVDKLASLEKNYPVFVKPTDEVVDAVKTYSTTKLEDAKVYSTEKINQLAGATGVNYMLGVAEYAVDKLLPEMEVEEEEDDSSPPAALLEEVCPQDTVNRALVLGGKVKHRAYMHAMSKVGALQRRSEEAVSKLVHTVDLIDFAKKNLSEKLSYGEVKEKFNSVYGEIINEEEEPLPSSANWEKKAISSARVLTRRICTTLDTMSKLAYALPTQTRSIVTSAYNSAEALYKTLTDSDLANNGKEFLAQLKANVEILKVRVIGIGSDLLDTANSILQATPLASVVGLRRQRQLAGFEVPTRFSETIDDEDDEDAESEVDAHSEVESVTAADSEEDIGSEEEDDDVDE